MIESKQLLKFKEKTKVIKNEGIITSCLDKTSREYRPYDPGWYLYRELNQKREKLDIFNDEFIELIYVTLSSWNMNTRAAKLAEFNAFKELLRGNKELILSLGKFRIEGLTESETEKVLGVMEQLFYNLKDLCHQESKVVTFSKCLHFLLPNLIVPVDRKYTLAFFGYKYNIPKELPKQFELYQNLFLAFTELSHNFDLKKYSKSRWNENIPKVLDNIIIGYQKLK